MKQVLKEELPAMAKRYEKHIAHFNEFIDTTSSDVAAVPQLASSFKVTREHRNLAKVVFLDREWVVRLVADPARARSSELVCYQVDPFGRTVPEYRQTGKAYMDINGNLGLQPEQKTGVIDEHAFDILIHLMGLSDLSDADLI